MATSLLYSAQRIVQVANKEGFPVPILCLSLYRSLGLLRMVVLKSFLIATLWAQAMYQNQY